MTNHMKCWRNTVSIGQNAFFHVGSKLLLVEWEEQSNKYGTQNNGGYQMAQTSAQINNIQKGGRGRD